MRIPRDLGVYEETSIDISNIRDPHLIEYHVNGRFEGSATFEDSWVYDADEGEQTLKIGYSTTIGPYVRWVEVNRISVLTRPTIHPLDILIEEGEGCAGSNAEMKACKARILNLWESEYSRVKQNLLIDEKSELLSILTIYEDIFERELYTFYGIAEGSHATNIWRNRQIDFYRNQINTLNALTAF